MNLETRLLSNFTEYADYVNNERAIVNAYDGLKPVARRILFTMYQMGLKPSGQTKKCATVVGKTMEFHPHGDVGIYNALVRSAQPFSVLHPIIQGVGNFGSLDSSPAAMRYCVTGDTLISTNKGVKRMEELIKNSAPNSENQLEVSVNSIGGVVNKTSKFFNSGFHEIFGIRLQGGMSLEGSFNHPILVLKPDFTIEWKTLEDIVVGDKALISKKGSQVFGENSDLLEARMLGVMVSEGYITTQNRIGASNKDIEMLTPVKDFWERESNPKAQINTLEDGMFGYCISSKKDYLTFIEKYEYAARAKDKTIPRAVLEGTKEYQSEFLKYLFEGDGSISRETISYSTYSKELARQLQILLLQQFGIFGAISLNKGQEYKVNITGEGLITFQQEIGFLSKRKGSFLNKGVKTYLEKERIAHNSYYTIPEINKSIRSKYKGEFFKKNTFANTKAVHKLKGRVDETLYRQMVEFLDQYMAIKVDSIYKKDPAPVYSVKVESECHSFTANGFINHNTESKISDFGYTLVEGMKKNIVPMVDNYDGTTKEPLFLPVPFPYLLVNGTMGIGVGMAASIPSHNLSNVLDMMIYYIDNPKATSEDLAKHLVGPDFASGCDIVNKDDFSSIYSSGSGGFRMRAKFSVSGRQVKATNLPYKVSGARVMEQLMEAQDRGEAAFIRDIVDMSSNEEVILIEVNTKDTEMAIKELCRLSDLEKTFSLNLSVVLDKPIQMNLGSYVEAWTSIHKDINRKDLLQQKEKAEDRKHIVDGLLKAILSMDEIIVTIRESEDRAAAQKALTIKGFSELQSKAILDMRLARLTKLNGMELEKENEELAKTISNLNNLLNSEADFNARLIDQFKQFYPMASNRHSEISNNVFPKRVKNETTEFSVELKGNRALISEGYSRKNNSYNGDKESPVYVFTENFVIPVKNTTDPVVPKVWGVLETDTKYVYHISEDGFIKKTAAKTTHTSRKAIVAKQTKVIQALMADQNTDDNSYVLLTLNDGKRVQFIVADINPTGRNARGVIAVKLGKGQKVVSAEWTDQLPDVQTGRNRLIK